jgi:hypothetical protein
MYYSWFVYSLKRFQVNYKLHFNQGKANNLKQILSDMNQTNAHPQTVERETQTWR